jgi:hypothetical protein
MTNGRHRFAFVEEMSRKFQCVLIRAQGIRIHESARDQERIKFLRAGLVERKIDVKFVAFVGMLHSLNFAGL